MLKNTLFLLALLLPAAARAQPRGPGTYALASDPHKSYRGALLLSESGLRVKDEAGNASRIAPEVLAYAKTDDGRVFVPAAGFLVPSGATYQKMGPTLVERLDSGRVCLLRYESATAGVLRYDGAYERTSQVSVYLARPAGAAEAVSLPAYAWTNQGAKLHAALRPYAAGRPDLLALLDGSAVRDDTLPAFFRALNSGQPFVKP
ncbi:hypothetical protein ACFQ48_19885 [Hymenobacter caeli]|uniref:Uncharacterized protein n=1 Tax=Hymenobacter caeli TaxID=2735894 RepID=A0ABX2FVJ4_9BACT|nr:hypothetical protein [Hymenobacter caeli]NRT21223.1 hypothetical protein [Hymenobacter caeli]